MAKKIIPGKPIEIPNPAKYTESDSVFDYEETFITEENPDIIAEEDPFENPPYEIPDPGEGP